MFGAWGRLVYRIRWLVLLASLAMVAGSVVAILNLQTSLSSSPDSVRFSPGGAREYDTIRIDSTLAGSAGAIHTSTENSWCGENRHPVGLSGGDDQNVKLVPSKRKPEGADHRARAGSPIERETATGSGTRAWPVEENW